mmetsp:Transcript_122115/g.346137  ORF Transcript_122115/g.346137 Transcript_122115/m.346137 type:complete len:284 (-) Transcript_122115:632-1483(-)
MTLMRISSWSRADDSASAFPSTTAWSPISRRIWIGSRMPPMAPSTPTTLYSRWSHGRSSAARSPSATMPDRASRIVPGCLQISRTSSTLPSAASSATGKSVPVARYCTTAISSSSTMTTNRSIPSGIATVLSGVEHRPSRPHWMSDRSRGVGPLTALSWSRSVHAASGSGRSRHQGPATQLAAASRNTRSRSSASVRFAQVGRRAALRAHPSAMVEVAPPPPSPPQTPLPRPGQNVLYLTLAFGSFSASKRSIRSISSISARVGPLNQPKVLPSISSCWERSA